jgi:aldehyde:ferredoxin oxidoreductase
MNGYHDRVAWIDLTKGSIDIRPFEPGDTDNFIGGSNMGTALLARLTGADTDPLGPENPLIFMTGPFTATRVPAGSRYQILGLSPLTGIFGEANCGGAFPRQLKGAGLDGLVFTGQSKTPVILVIDNESVTLRDAGDLWGQDYFDCDEALRKELGKGIGTAMIGPAGEKQVPMASVCHDGRHTRAAGRCGLGAVMGSKKLKGVVVLEGKPIDTPIADDAGLTASTKAFLPVIRERLKAFGIAGTPGIVVGFERNGTLSIDNWRGARAPELAEAIGGARMKETIETKRTGCRRCPILCARLVDVPDGPFATDGASEAPEFETLAGFGAMCMVDNLEAIAKANEYCNQNGIDTISASTAVAFAFECYEKGILTKADTGGLALEFGNAEAMVELARRIGTAEDELGRTLGRGVRHAAKTFGGSAAEYATEVKGLEMAFHDPRWSWGQALSYATGNRGGCHMTSHSTPFENVTALPELGYDEPYPHRVREGKAQHVVHLQNLMSMQDSLISCKMSMANNTVRISHYIEWYNLITGNSMDVDSFMATGARGFNLKRMINNRRGITRKDDTLPPRMTTLKKADPERTFDVPPIEQLLSDYYELRGWTEEGRPGAGTVKELGLAGW